MYYYESPEYLIQMMERSTNRRLVGSIDGVSFTGSDVVQGSLEIVNRCAEQSNMKIGGVYIGEMSLTFVPSFLTKVPRGNFIGKDISISIGLYVEENEEWEDIPIGIYTIQSADISKEGISIEALDYMKKFDSTFISGAIYGSAYDLLKLSCRECGVELGVTKAFVDALPNGDEVLYLIEENDIETYRDLIYWIAQTVVCFATINREGKLELRQYGLGTTEFDEEHRDVDCVYSDFVTHWTSISAEDLDEGEVQYYHKIPDDGLMMNLGMNPLLQTVADVDIQELITFLEGEIAEFERKEEEAGDEMDALEGQLDYVEEQLREHPDDPELLAEKARLENEISKKEDYIDYLGNEKEKVEKELEDVRSGLVKKSKVFKDRARKRILNGISQIQFSPFSVNSARDPIFDLGDQIVFTGGIAEEVTGCIMAYSYHLDSYSFEGYGDNPELTDARSSTDKSVTGVKNSEKKDISKVGFSVFTNAERLVIHEDEEVDVGYVRFGLDEDADVEAWVELKMNTKLNSELKAGVMITYYLDNEEVMSYHPVEEWQDKGETPDFELQGTRLIFSASSGSGDESIHTIGFNYHISNISAASPHIWKVSVTGLNGEEIIETGDAHIVVWAHGLKGEGEWTGFIEANDEYPVYPIMGMDLFGSIIEGVDVDIVDISDDNLITEDGDNIITEDGDNITILNIEDLPMADELDGSEVLPIVQNGSTVKVSLQDIIDDLT